jgi:acyl CoA:acetate/3-ketoacid CoA transferase alpha subunit
VRCAPIGAINELIEGGFLAEITTIREAITALVRDGSTLAMEGFTYLIPFAAGARGDGMGSHSLFTPGNNSRAHSRGIDGVARSSCADRHGAWVGDGGKMSALCVEKVR